MKKFLPMDNFTAFWDSAGHSESEVISFIIYDKRFRGRSVAIGWLSPKLQIYFI